MLFESRDVSHGMLQPHSSFRWTTSCSNTAGKHQEPTAVRLLLPDSCQLTQLLRQGWEESNKEVLVKKSFFQEAKAAPSKTHADKVEQMMQSEPKKSLV